MAEVREVQPSRSGVRQTYDRLVVAQSLQPDPDQIAVINALDHLGRALDEAALANKSSALGWLFSRRKHARPQLRGLYIHGSVGRGKTMMMDLFFKQVRISAKRRVHFNDFMAEVHDRIGRYREDLKAGLVKGDDPIVPVAAAIAQDAQLLCFDEFSVTDIADAMILGRLFTALFTKGVVLVATSNVAPDDLYREGLNRALFLPFLETLKEHVDILDLNGDLDWRLANLDRLPVYMVPLGEAADRQMDRAWAIVTEGRSVVPTSIRVKGREIKVSASAGDVARFSFGELCVHPLGARDYLAIAHRFAMIFVDHIPLMDASQHNEAKRLILLIDVLYDNHVRLIASAAAEPAALFRGREGAVEMFEFDRTISRLTEMQSVQWRDHVRKARIAHGHVAPQEPSKGEAVKSG